MSRTALKSFSVCGSFIVQSSLVTQCIRQILPGAARACPARVNCGVRERHGVHRAPRVGHLGQQGGVSRQADRRLAHRYPRFRARVAVIRAASNSASGLQAGAVLQDAAALL